VRVTLTNDLNKIFKALQVLEPKGKVNFVTGIRIAHVSSCPQWQVVCVCVCCVCVRVVCVLVCVCVWRVC